jgi:hypothetical protein
VSGAVLGRVPVGAEVAALQAQQVVPMLRRSQATQSVALRARIGCFKCQFEGQNRVRQATTPWAHRRCAIEGPMFLQPDLAFPSSTGRIGKSRLRRGVDRSSTSNGA